MRKAAKRRLDAAYSALQRLKGRVTVVKEMNDSFALSDSVGSIDVSSAEDEVWLAINSATEAMATAHTVLRSKSASAAASAASRILAGTASSSHLSSMPLAEVIGQVVEIAASSVSTAERRCEVEFTRQQELQRERKLAVDELHHADIEVEKVCGAPLLPPNSLTSQT